MTVTGSNSNTLALAPTSAQNSLAYAGLFLFVEVKKLHRSFVCLTRIRKQEDTNLVKKDVDAENEEGVGNLSTLRGVPGFPGYYASNRGLVLKKSTGLVLKTTVLRSGKPAVGLLANGRRSLTPLATVIMDVFEGGTSHQSRYIEHIDGNVHNCDFDNLRYSAVAETPDSVDHDMEESVILDSICEPGEIWADLPSSAGYLISSHGRIRRKGSSKVRIPGNGVTGYLASPLRGKNVYAHRAVAEVFVPKDSPEKNCVTHLDGDRHNNHASNLAWCTYSQSATMRTPEKAPRKTHSRVSRATREYVLKDMPGKFSKSLCLSMTEEMHDDLVKISEDIDHPVTAIFRHAIIEFVENYRANNVAPVKPWDIADTNDDDGEGEE